jgi:O-antigen ligase
MRLLSYGLVFLMSAQYCQESQNAKTLFNWLSFAGFCYASYALVIFVGDYKTILWYDKMDTSASSTFINRNSYATYAGLAILCGIPMLYEKIKISSHYGLKNNFGRQYFIENFIKQGWTVITNLIISIATLSLTQSRGGILSTLVGLLSLFTLLSFYKQNKQNAFTYSVAGFLFLILIAFQFIGDKLMQRFIELDMLKDSRHKIFNVIINGINNNPWFGMGYGTFEHSFRLYRDESLNFHVNLGHNTYLENIFELGLPQALLLFTAIALVALQCLKGVRVRQKNILYPALGFSATMLVASHSLTDFSLQIPAVAVTYAAILGGAFAQSFSHRHSFSA